MEHVSAACAGRGYHGDSLYGRCTDCGMTWEEQQAQAQARTAFPPIGAVEGGSGELAGGDVQALPRERAPRRRKATRHDQRTPLPGDPGWEGYRAGRLAARDELQAAADEQKHGKK